ncbi:MAG TPA: GNAT family N-acetyltransferase [Tepidisphaeraceae bacterium]|jgi:L-amino acid N-acyltransferase YncA
MSVRKAILNDAPALAEVQMASWQQAYRDILPQHVINAWNATRPAQWYSYLRDPNHKTQNFVCEIDSSIVGFALFGSCRDEGADARENAELYSLYIHPNYWRHGAGRALCANVVQAAGELQFADLCVWTFTANARSRRFYESIGFILQPARSKDITLEGLSFAEVCYWQKLR